MLRIRRPGRTRLLPLALLGLGALGACDDPGEPGIEPLECTSQIDQGLCLATVATGLRFPLQLEQPEGDDRIFVAEQAGRIRVIRNDRLVTAPFLDIRSEVLVAPERGLIGMAFHPQFASNGHVFVTFTDLDGNIRVQRFTAGAGQDAVDLATRKEILVIERESGQHNGGLLRFGPDGMLWMSVGDGQQEWQAQDTASLFGSLLRIDVDGGDPYAIPADNPFVDEPNARPEIWAMGLRNPWRFSFESGNRLFIADVGQSAWEELNITAVDQAGLNFGWPYMEGSHCFAEPTCDPEPFVLPAFEYGHDLGCSIIGGSFYDRADLPALAGRYVFGDFCGWVGSVAVDGATVSDFRILDLGDIGLVTSLGRDADGRIYVLSFTGGGDPVGSVARLQPAQE